MKCKEIQNQGNVDWKLKNKKKQKLKEKGITLIALVVTIIILLILAGVTLNMAMLGDGLFSKARNTTDKYKKAQEDEAELISDIAKEMYSEYVGAYVTGYTPTVGNCTIQGQIVGLDNNQNNGNTIDGVNINGDQTFTTENDLKWRIWDFDGTTLRIISEKPTDATLTLKGANGYNNGVWAINEVCRKCYGQYEEGKKTMKEGISVANLRRSDIQKVSVYNYTNFSHNSGNWGEVAGGTGTLKFGQTKTYLNNNTKYPEIWGENDKDWIYEIGSNNDKECLIWENEGKPKGELDGIEEGSVITTFKQSYYSHNYKNEKNQFKNQKYYDMIFANENDKEITEGYYWLAGRYVRLDDDNCDFGLQRIRTTGTQSLLFGGDLFFSKDTPTLRTCSLRPIISINLSDSGYVLNRIINEDNISYELKSK